MKKEQRMAKEITEQLGGTKNIRGIAHCMTRLRLTLHDESKVNMELLKKVDGVMGVIEDETLQVVVGPGTVNKVAAEMETLTGLRIGEVADQHLEDLGQEMKSAIKKKIIHR